MVKLAGGGFMNIPMIPIPMIPQHSLNRRSQVYLKNISKLKKINDILKKNYLIISQKCLKNMDVYSARHLDPSWATSIGEVGVPYKPITSHNQWHIDIWKCHLDAAHIDFQHMFSVNTSCSNTIQHVPIPSA